MNIGDNINSFRLKSELNNEKKSQPVSSVYSDSNPLTYALREVEINSPDSIALALSMLQKHHIEVPPALTLLNQLHMQIGARDISFENKSRQLQQQAIVAIKEIIQKNG